MKLQTNLCLVVDHIFNSFFFSLSLKFCQICRKGDNEELLLLCDGCDRGYHTYCCMVSCVRNFSVFRIFQVKLSSFDILQQSCSGMVFLQEIVFFVIIS